MRAGDSLAGAVLSTEHGAEPPDRLILRRGAFFLRNNPDETAIMAEQIRRALSQTLLGKSDFELDTPCPVPRAPGSVLRARSTRPALTRDAPTRY